MKREGEPKRNTRVEIGYCAFVNVTKEYVGIIRRHVHVKRLSVCKKFQSYDSYLYSRGGRGCVSDVLLKVRSGYIHVSDGIIVNQRK